jgi:heat shock protein HtpX
MVTLTLIQGVVNTFVVFLSPRGRLLRRPCGCSQNDREGPGIGYYVTSIALRDHASASPPRIIVAWFSRQREFRADAGRPA